MRFQLRSRSQSNSELKSGAVLLRHYLTGLAVMGVVLSSVFLHYDSANAELELCGSFYFPAKSSPDDILKENEAALIKLDVGDEKGTGFLIDNEYGYVVTARHVVSPAIGNNLIPIKGSSLGQSKKLLLTVLHEDSDSDIAVLQLSPHKALKSIVPLEIAVNDIDVFGEYAFAGFPLEKDIPTTMKGKLTSSRRAVERLSGERAGKTHFQMRVNVFGGDSGAPVVDRYGLVVGIVFQNAGTDLALIRPTLYLFELLRKLPPMEVSEDLYRQLDSGPADEFFNRFLPVGTTSRISNLHFISFLMKLAGQKQIISAAQRYISCPVLTAANHRGLGIPADQFGPQLRNMANALNLEKFAQAVSSRSNALHGDARLVLEQKIQFKKSEEEGKKGLDGFSENLKGRLSKEQVGLPLPSEKSEEEGKKSLDGFSENLKRRLSKEQVSP